MCHQQIPSAGGIFPRNEFFYQCDTTPKKKIPKRLRIKQEQFFEGFFSVDKIGTHFQ